MHLKTGSNQSMASVGCRVGGGGGGRIKVTGSQEDIGKLETSMGGHSYTTHYGSYIYTLAQKSAGESFWPLENH